MFGLNTFRRTHQYQTERRLALPPGYHRVFQGQRMDVMASRMMADNVVITNALQNNDPDSADFGKIDFLVGYDPL